LQIADANLSPCRVNFLDFMADADVDPLPLPKLFRRADYKCIFPVDNPADIVGDPSGGIGGVGASLENDDLQVGTAPSGLGCGAHPCRIAADDDKPFVGHGFSSSVEYQEKTRLCYRWH
jgi:hypothetical protein